MTLPGTRGEPCIRRYHNYERSSMSGIAGLNIYFLLVCKSSIRKFRSLIYKRIRGFLLVIIVLCIR